MSKVIMIIAKISKAKVIAAEISKALPCKIL